MTAPGRASPSGDAEEQRAAARRRVLLSGKVVFADGAQSVDCAIRDLSRTGAKVRLAGALVLPNEVYLIELKSGFAFESRVVWRRLPDAGLRFTGMCRLGESDDPRLKSLKRIWIEHIAR